MSDPATRRLALLLALTLAGCAPTTLAEIRAKPIDRSGMFFGDYKTVEGSAAFFLVAFACIAIPLAWFTPASNPEAVAVAALVAMAATVLEASMGGGFDNLFVPLGAFAALQATGLTRGQPDALESGSPVVVAALALAAALLVLLVVGLASWRRTAKGSQR